jgi:truncated hemoglobin YjbI
MKAIATLSAEVNQSLWNLRKVFPNSLHEHFSKEKERLQAFYENPLKYSKSEGFLKDHEHVTPFQNLLMVKVLKPEFTVEAITTFIKETLG